MTASELLTLRGRALMALADGPLSVPELAYKLARSARRITTVLQDLRRRGVVQYEWRGRRTYWRLAPDASASRPIDPTDLFRMEVRNARQEAAQK